MTVHPFPYQGSKRHLAARLLAWIPADTKRLMEPFAGSAALSIAAATTSRASQFWLADCSQPLMDLWQAILAEPHVLAAGYRRLWEAQQGRDRAFYDEVRARFNHSQQPADFLFLLARCVKAAVRFNARGEFNNSPDKRRRGMHPDSMTRNLCGVSELLAGRTRITCADFEEALEHAQPDDVVYLDPPYQGVSLAANRRYASKVEFASFVAALERLNARRVPYLVSYDGRTGQRQHGRLLPDSLGLQRRELPAGRSSQATLLGRHETTVESVYLSPELVARLPAPPAASQMQLGTAPSLREGRP